MIRRLPPVYSPVAPRAVLRELVHPPWIRSSDARSELRRMLEDRYRADHVILCGSGTQALQLALTAARRETGRDTAALPAYTCYDIVSAAVGTGVQAAFYDIDPHHFLPAPTSLARAVEAGVAAVVVVHHFGIPTPMEPILEAAEAAGALVVEDAAQAHGGELGGRPLGSFGPISVLSFGRGKGWTGGGGGALLLRGEARRLGDELEAELAPASGGRTAAAKLGAQWLLGRPWLYGLPAALPWLGLGETHYRPPVAPKAMAPAVARLVLAVDGLAAEEATGRRRTAARLLEGLAAAPDILQRPPERGQPGWLRLPLRIPEHPAEDLLSSLARRLGFVPSYPCALPTLDAAPLAPGHDAPTEGASVLARELFTVPTHGWLRDRDFDTIMGVLFALPSVIIPVGDDG